MNVDEAVAYLEECEEDELPLSQTVDIVELPPDRIDVISDEEEFDENDLTEAHIADVPGSVKIGDLDQDDNSEDEENVPGTSRVSKQPKAKT